MKRPQIVVQLEADEIDLYRAKKACYKVYNRERLKQNRFLFIPNRKLTLLMETGRNKFDKNFQKHVRDILDLQILDTY